MGPSIYHHYIYIHIYIDTWLTQAWTATIGHRSNGSQIWPIKWNAVSSKQRSCRYCYMDALLGRWLNGWRKSLTATTQECCEQHHRKWQLYCHLPPITKTIKVRRTRHAGHCWRSRDELIGDVLNSPSGCRAKVGRPAQTYIQQLCEDTGYSPEDLSEAMNDWEEWWERVRDIRAGGTTWWWWWWWYTFVCDNIAHESILYIL